MSSEADDDRGGVGQGDLLCDGRPAAERGALQAKEEKYETKEALDGCALDEGDSLVWKTIYPSFSS